MGRVLFALRRWFLLVPCAVLIAALPALFHSGPASAQEIGAARIAVLEMRGVEANALAWKDLREKFQAANQRILGELRGIQEDLSEEGQALQQQQAILSPEAFEEQRQAFEQRLQSVNQDAAERRQAIEKALADARKQILAEFNQVLVEIANEENLQLILDRSNADPTIVLTSPDIDITERVVQRLDQRITSVDFSVPPPQ